jgi:hypothetical protein
MMYVNYTLNIPYSWGIKLFDVVDVAKTLHKRDLAQY